MMSEKIFLSLPLPEKHLRPLGAGLWHAGSRAAKRVSMSAAPFSASPNDALVAGKAASDAARREARFDDLDSMTGESSHALKFAAIAPPCHAPLRDIKADACRVQVAWLPSAAESDRFRPASRVWNPAFGTSNGPTSRHPAAAPRKGRSQQIVAAMLAPRPAPTCGNVPWLRIFWETRTPQKSS